MVPLRSNLAGLTALLVTALALLAGRDAADAQPDNKDELVDRWINAQTNIQTWSAEFIQTRTLKAFSQPLVSTGQVWFATPDRFRWELGNPPQTIVVRQPAEMTVLYPKLKRAERYPLDGKQPGQWKDVFALLEVGFPRTRHDLENRFDIVKADIKGETCELVLQPKSASARRMMPQLSVSFRTNDFSLTATELQFADGSTMRNDFREPKINPTLNESLFKPQVPPEFKVVEPLTSQKVLLK